MKFLCLMYCEPHYFDAAGPDELKAFQKGCADVDRALEKSGHLISAVPLESTMSATTFRIRNGKNSFTDGPFAETKEQLCGFVFLEARDLEETKSLLANHPFAKAGSVEIRPVMVD